MSQSLSLNINVELRSDDQAGLAESATPQRSTNLTKTDLPSQPDFSAELAAFRNTEDLHQHGVAGATLQPGSHSPASGNQTAEFNTADCNLNVRGLPCGVDSPPQQIGDSSYRRAGAGPHPSFSASNFDPDRSRRYLLNGMNSRRDSIEQDLQLLTAMTGQPVTAVVNSSGSSFLKNTISAVVGLFSPPAADFIKEHASRFLGDVVSATASFLSPTLARYMEPEAVGELREHLLSDFRAGRRSTIDVFSQGGSILKAALISTQNDLSTDEWEEFRKGVTVIASGSAAHSFPEGIEVIEYEHSGDLVSSLTRPLATVRDSVFSLGGLLGNNTETVQPEVVTLAPGAGRTAHDFTTYIENYPRFFLAAHRNTDGTLDVPGFATALAQSIEQGHYSDQMHRKLIEQVLRCDQAEQFRQVFAGFVDEGGYIGQFQVYSQPASTPAPDHQSDANRIRSADQVESALAA